MSRLQAIEESRCLCVSMQGSKYSRQAKVRHPVLVTPLCATHSDRASYLQQLENEIQTMRGGQHHDMEQPNHDATSSPSRDEPTNAASYERRDADSTGLQESTGARPDLLAIEQVETYVSNPLHVRYTTTEGGMSARCSYVGDAACEAFTTRVRRHVKEDDSIAPPRHEGYFKSTNLLRLVNKDFQLPERGYAMLLIDTAESIVGTEYHMFLRRTFLKQFDEFYKSGTSNDPVWLCGLFAILALGELYSNIPVRADHSEADIPGTSFFLQAMNLFEDLYEEPTISYIETILLLVRTMVSVGSLRC